MTVEKVCMEERIATYRGRSFFIQFFCLPSLVQYNQLLKQLQAVNAKREREKGNWETFEVYNDT